MTRDLGHLSAIRRRIAAALDERRPDLADMYLSALELLDTPPRDQLGARTRVAYVCHSMREVMNRVLGALGRPPAPRIKPSTSHQVQQLPDLLSRFPDLDLALGEDSVPVPREVASAMAGLIEAAVLEKRRSRDDVAALLTDDGNAAHAAVSKWIEVRGFFVKWAHLHDREVPADALPSDDEIWERIGVFETLLDGVVTEFFEVRHSIDDLLAEINATEEDAHA